MMHQRCIITVLAILAISSLACGPLQAVLATPTPTPTNTPTPTATPTSTPTPTTTPTPQPTATPTPSPGLDLSGVVIMQSDVPSGFVEIPYEEIEPMMDASMPDCDGCEIDVISMFMNPNTVEVLMSMAMPLESTMDQVAFDASIANQDLTEDLFMMGLMTTAPEDTEIREYEELPDLGNIGDNSAGITLVIGAEFFDMRIDLAIFRRGEVGIIVFLFYPDGIQTTVSLSEVSLALDERAIEALQYQQ